MSLLVSSLVLAICGQLSSLQWLHLLAFSLTRKCEKSIHIVAASFRKAYLVLL